MRKLVTIALEFSLIAATMLPFAPATHAESPTGKEAQANPTVKIRLPERFRLLTDQLFDLRIEVTNLTNLEASVKVLLDGIDLTPSLGAPGRQCRFQKFNRRAIRPHLRCPSSAKWRSLDLPPPDSVDDREDAVASRRKANKPILGAPDRKLDMVRE